MEAVVEKFVSCEHLERFDHLAGTRGTLALFLVYRCRPSPRHLVRGRPDAHRSGVSSRLLAGRLPGCLLSVGGNGLAYDDPTRSS